MYSCGSENGMEEKIGEHIMVVVVVVVWEMFD